MVFRQNGLFSCIKGEEVLLLGQRAREFRIPGGKALLLKCLQIPGPQSGPGILASVTR